MAASIIDDERVLPGKIYVNSFVLSNPIVLSLDAVPVIREFLRSIYAKHSAAFIQVMQSLNEPLRLIVTKHLQTN